MTLNEAAESLGVVPATLRQQIRHGRLRARKMGRDWYVSEDEVERYRRESRRSKDYAIEVVPADVETFWSKVTKTDGCWTFQTAGYGYANMVTHGPNNPRVVKAHRFSWTLHNGQVPPGLRVCHHCDNPPCVRPDHLFLGTDADNMRDKVAKGRHRKESKR